MIKIRIAGIVAVGLAAMSAWAGITPQAIPFANGFDYSNGTQVITLNDVGWDASGPLVVVQTNVAPASDTNAVLLPPNQSLSNAIAPAVLTNVWLDFYVQMAPEEVAPPDVNTNAITMFYLDEFGSLTAFNAASNVWETYTSYIGGASIPTLTNQWVHVSLNQNYSTRQCALFLNGKNVRNQLPFINNTVASCSFFRMNGGDAVFSYLDNVSVQSEIPAWLNNLANDWNSNGIPDALEVQTYGYVGVPLYVGVSQPYTSLQAAVTAARQLDWVHVIQEPSVEDVRIGHSFRMITGQVFTVNGNLTLATGVGMTSWVGFACADLGVEAVGRLSVFGDVLANNVTVGTGAFLAVSGTLTNLGLLTVGTNAVTTIGGALVNGSNIIVQTAGQLTVAGAVNAVAITLADGAILTARTNLLCTDLTTGSNATVTVLGSLTNQNVILGTNATLTVSGAMSSSNVTLGVGAQLSATGVVTALAVSLGDGAALRTPTNLICTSLTPNPNATLSVGGTLMVTNDLVLNSNATVTVGGMLTGVSNLTLNAGSRLTVSNGPVSTLALTVGNGAGFRGLGNLAFTTLNTGTGATVSVSGNVTAAGDLSLSNRTTMTVSGTITALNVNVNAGAVLIPGGGITASNLVLGAQVTLNVVNADVVLTNLTIQAGGRLVITNGTLTANGVVLRGTFTVGDTWGDSLARSTLTFTDDFELYQLNTPLSLLGFRGWGASDIDVVISTNLAYGTSTNAVSLPYDRMVSNRVNAAGALKVWTDIQYTAPHNLDDEQTPVNSNAVIMVLVSSNGYLSVYEPVSGTWEEYRTNFFGSNVNTVASGEWVHLSIFNNFTTRESAVFRNGALMRQHLRFINTNASQYSVFGFTHTEPSGASLDNVLIGEQVPASLTNDLDANGMSDALSIHLYGDVNTFASGTTYMIR